MIEILTESWLIIALFCAVAIVYTAVGLGGGTSYAALMVIFGFASASIPNLSLLFNLIATSIGAFNYIRRGHLRWQLLAPFVVLSLPMAWIGGALQLPENGFRWLLALSLAVVAAKIFFRGELKPRLQENNRLRLLLALVAGAVLGLLAGIVGIGGGIFLVPLILLFGLGTLREAAACGVVFIWLNSLVGLASRSQYNFIDLGNYLPLVIAVALGASIGSLLGSSRFPAEPLEKLLGIVILIAVGLLLQSLLFA